MLTPGLATLVLVAGGAAAATTVGNRKKTFPALLTYVARDGGLCMVRADGSHAVRLTPRWKHIENPSWSTDGHYVAFDRSEGYDSYGEQPDAKVVVTDARGRVRRSFGAGNTNARPLWSPDGRHIAYVAQYAHSYEFEIARRDGSDDHSVAYGDGYGYPTPRDPAWTPDGQRLLFDDASDPWTGGRSIFSVALDGGDRRVLLANAAEAAYSPDGSRLAYVKVDEHERLIGIAVANADGSNPQLIVSSTSGAWLSVPAWSPKGTAVAFAEETVSPEAATTAIIVARADGTSKRIAASDGHFLGWSPDGKLIAFERGRGIFVVRPDGSGERLLVTRGSPRGAAWRPAVALPAAKRLRCPRR